MEIGSVGLLARGAIHPAKGHQTVTTLPGVVEAPAEPTAPATTEPTAADEPRERWGGGRPGRAHVQQSLHRLERLVRREIESELAAAPDGEYATAVRQLDQDFSAALRDAFHEAGRGHDFDRGALLGSIATAVGDLTAGLQQLRESVMPEPEPTVVEPTDPAAEPATPLVEPPEGTAVAPATEPDRDPTAALAAYAEPAGVEGGLLAADA